MKIVITEAQYNKLIENESDEIIKCNQCGWEWKKSEGGKDPLVCHQCGHDNDPKSKFGQPKWVRCRNCKKRFTQTVMRNGKKSLPICHHCGTHNQDIDEIQMYDHNDDQKIAKYKKKRDYSILKKDSENNIFLKKVGKFDFYYSASGEESELVISIVDPIEKTMVGHASFFMVNADDWEAAAPFIDPDYRNLGLATMIYKMALDFGNIVSGGMQSRYAIGLWKKLYRELPNKMVALDKTTYQEYPIKLEHDHLKIDAEDAPDLYGEDTNIVLKIERN